MMAKIRDPWLDNAKMVLVTIVVIGHMIVLVPVSYQQQRVYDFIYYFHIPAFVLITGYLSKSFRYSRRHLWALVTTLVVPYFVFSWLMVQFRHHVGGEPLLDPIWTNPRWPMWYLVAVIAWRLLTPVLRWHWLMIPASIAVSLLFGRTNQEFFDLNRILGLLPFFVIGLHLTAGQLGMVRRRGAWILGVIGVLALWQLTKHTNDFWATQFLYYRASYAELGVSDGEGMWIRARLIVVALLAMAAVFTLIPRGRSFLTRMGVWTLVVYLCHGFVVRFLEYRGYEDWLPTGSPWTGIAITIALGVALALFLAWEPVARTLNYLVDPVNSFGALRRRRTSSPTSGLA